MIKQAWTTLFLRTSTAKIYANSNVEWIDNSGRKLSGKVKQIFNDRVSVSTSDGSIHLVNANILKKVFNR